MGVDGPTSVFWLAFLSTSWALNYLHQALPQTSEAKGLRNHVLSPKIFAPAKAEGQKKELTVAVSCAKRDLYYYMSLLLHLLLLIFVLLLLLLRLLFSLLRLYIPSSFSAILCLIISSTNGLVRHQAIATDPT